MNRLDTGAPLPALVNGSHRGGGRRHSGSAGRAGLSGANPMSTRVAVVTGANRGIGRAITVALAAGGFTVAATARDPASLADTAAEAGKAISSMTGKRPLHGRTPYAAAKMGVIGLVRTLATELGPCNIRVNAVCPGPVAGPRMEDVVRKQAAIRGITVRQARAALTGASPLGRMVEAGEVAAACAFLVSDGSAAVTGEDLNVTAGVVMY